jgi:hypothetical protein
MAVRGLEAAAAWPAAALGRRRLPFRKYEVAPRDQGQEIKRKILVRMTGQEDETTLFFK